MRERAPSLVASLSCCNFAPAQVPGGGQSMRRSPRVESLVRLADTSITQAGVHCMRTGPGIVSITLQLDGRATASPAPLRTPRRHSVHGSGTAHQRVATARVIAVLDAVGLPDVLGASPS
jgi:hypothetical protein